jgi:hypothetical protein
VANIKITQLGPATVPLAGTEVLELVQASTSVQVAASAIANTATNVRTVATGGTGAATLTGYVKGTGTTPMTAAATIPVADIAGTLTVAQGGTGAATLTVGQYLKGNGTSAITSTATIPYNDMSGRAYISAFSAIDQTGSTSVATTVIIGTTNFSSGISITNNGSGNPTRITFTEAGVYAIMPSLQFTNSDSADHDVNIWFVKNGTNIANSNTVISVPKAADGGNTFFQIVLYEQVTAGQYIEVFWLPVNVAVTLDYIGAGAIAPAAPSVILSAERIA